MTHGKHNSKDAEYIAVEDLIGRLGLLEEDVFEWLSRDKPNVKNDRRGRPSIPLEFLERYSGCAEYETAFKRALAAERLSRDVDDVQISLQLKIKRSELLNLYDVFIIDLENLHRKYLRLVNRVGRESSAMAAYLLFK
jgi:hypothetical protein